MVRTAFLSAYIFNWLLEIPLYSIVLYYKYIILNVHSNVCLLNTICRGLFPPVFVTVHASICPSVTLHLQVTWGTSRWESSSFICQLSVIEQKVDSKHSCSSAGIVTLASAYMSVHIHCAAWCFIRCALNLTTQTHKYKFKLFSWYVVTLYHAAFGEQSRGLLQQISLIYCCNFNTWMTCRWHGY